LHKGVVMKELKKGKPQGYIWLNLSSDCNQLQWGPVDSATTTFVENPPNSLDMGEIESIATGDLLSAHYKVKRVDDEIYKNGFALLLREGSNSLDFLALERNHYVTWADGLRVMMNQPVACPESTSAIDAVIIADVATRMINLQGLSMPKEKLEVPEVPDNFNFYVKDD